MEHKQEYTTEQAKDPVATFQAAREALQQRIDQGAVDENLARVLDLVSRVVILPDNIICYTQPDNRNPDTIRGYLLSEDDLAGFTVVMDLVAGTP